MALHGLGERINGIVARSFLGRLFRLDGSGHRKQIKDARFLTELRAGATTFFTMAYIISVNASILSQTGATCECTSTTDPVCDTDPAYNLCVLAIQRDYITATAAICTLSCILFGVMTNLPIAFAPGMGINAYFAFQVVGYHGTGVVPFRLALAAVFMEGFIFIFLSLIGMRQWLVKIIPKSMKVAMSVGVGLFLTIIGFSNGAGIGAITGSKDTPVALGGCPAQYLSEFGECQSHKVTDPRMWLGIIGGLLTTFLMLYRVKSSIIIGILFVSIVSWPRTTGVTYFPYDEQGTDRFNFFKKVVAFHPIENILNVVDWDISKAGGQFVLALFTFLYVDILDSTGTLYSLARYSGVVDDTTGDFPRSTIAYCTDAICISIGALFGTSPVTGYVESAAGITEGGRTGLTPVTTGLCFFVSLFFAPIFASIPPWATGCTLILVGCMMMRTVTEINWKYLGDAAPAFITIVFTPFSYSISYGLIAGLLTYVALNGSAYLLKVISGGRIVPREEELREYWTIIPKGGSPPWFVRLFRGQKQFWKQEPVSKASSVSEQSAVVEADSKNITETKVTTAELK